MTNQERSIAEFLLNAIEKATNDERLDAIYAYKQFLETVQTRLQIEAQCIENRKQA